MGGSEPGRGTNLRRGVENPARLVGEKFVVSLRGHRTGQLLAPEFPSTPV